MPQEFAFDRYQRELAQLHYPDNERRVITIGDSANVPGGINGIIHIESTADSIKINTFSYDDHQPLLAAELHPGPLHADQREAARLVRRAITIAQSAERIRAASQP